MYIEHFTYYAERDVKTVFITEAGGKSGVEFNSGQFRFEFGIPDEKHTNNDNIVNTFIVWTTIID